MPKNATTPSLSPAACAVRDRLAPAEGATTAHLADQTGLSRSTVAKALTVLESAELARREQPGPDAPARTPDLWFAPARARSGRRTETKTTAPANPAPLREDQDDRQEQAEVPQDSATAEAAGVPESTPDIPTPATESLAKAHDATAQEPAPAPGTDMVADRSATDGEAGACAAELGAAPQPDPAPARPRAAKGELRGKIATHLAARPDQTFTPSALSKALGHSAGAISNALDTLVASGNAVQVTPAPRAFQHAEPAPTGA